MAFKLDDMNSASGAETGAVFHFNVNNVAHSDDAMRGGMKNYSVMNERKKESV